MIAVAILPLFMEGTLLGLALLGDWRHRLPAFFILFALLFAAFLLSLRLLKNEKRVWFWFLWAVIFRLSLFPTLPSLSTDVYRYAWDGHVQRSGFSPYEHAPDSQALEAIRTPTYRYVEHRHVPAVYPIFTQWCFYIGSGISAGLQRVGMDVVRSDVWGQKIVFLFFDLAIIGILLRLLAARGRPSSEALYYAWNPLVILEFAGSSHNDSLGIFLLVAGLACWEARKSLHGAAALAGSFLAKYLSALLFPYLLWKRRWREAILFAGLAGTGFALSSLLLDPASDGARYLTRWHFNGSFYSFAELLLGNNSSAAKWLASGLIGTAALWIGRQEKEFVRAAFLIIAATLFLAPTVHPWYFVWLVPFLCLFRTPALIAWNGTIVLSYCVWPEYWRTSVWQLPAWVLWAEYLPVYGLLGHAVYRNRFKRAEAV
jgi:hypothetical protein